MLVIKKTKHMKKLLADVKESLLLGRACNNLQQLQDFTIVY